MYFNVPKSDVYDKNIKIFLLSLFQYVFYDKTNPGVHYEYFSKSGESKSPPKYVWDFVDWSECSAKCGGGTMVKYSFEIKFFAHLSKN